MRSVTLSWKLAVAGSLAAANSCPESADVMTFEWDGKGLILEGSNRAGLPDTP
jgi:hypothetical protein